MRGASQEEGGACRRGAPEEGYRVNPGRGLPRLLRKTRVMGAHQTRLWRKTCPSKARDDCLDSKTGKIVLSRRSSAWLEQRAFNSGSGECELARKRSLVFNRCAYVSLVRAYLLYELLYFSEMPYISARETATVSGQSAWLRPPGGSR